MELNFVVGEREKHDVHFSWNQMWGGLKIAVDGIDVVSTVRILSFSLVKTYEFTVGVEEKHTVRIEKRREKFFAGFRPQVVTAWVDFQQTAEGVSSVPKWQAITAVVLGLVVLAGALFLYFLNRG